MTRNRITRKVFSDLATCSLVLVGAAHPVHSCTGTQLTAADGAVVHARTLEFAVDLQSNVVVVPRGYARAGATPDGKRGLKMMAGVTEE